MTYISAQLTENKQNVIVWERDTNGDRDYRVFHAPYYFYVPSEHGEHFDIYGKKLDKLEFNSHREFYQAKEEFRNSNIKIYESDIGPEYKILSKHYYNKPSGKLNITFLDIEVDKDPTIGYATIDNPYAPIISIALYHQYNNKFVIYAVPPDDTWTYDKIPDDINKLAEVVLCKDENQLLKCFLAEIENTDVISGWNSSLFDDPYIYLRLLNELGSEYARKLSFDGAKEPRVKEIEKFKVAHKTVELYGRQSIDYLELFKKLEREGRSSYKLESIADDVLPTLLKLEYEGSLHDTYRKNFLFFLRYNIRDTEILKALEEKFKYVEFAINFSHLATGMVNNVLGTIKLTDLTIINYCHYILDRIVPDISKDIGTKFMGAYVLEPQIGMHEFGSALDIVSLYPSAMRTLNISPETIIGQFIDKHKAYELFMSEVEDQLTLQYENGVNESYTPKEWKRIFKDNGWCISGYGTVYTQKIKGLLSTIISEWFDKRSEYKGEMKKVVKQVENILEKYKKSINEISSEDKVLIDELESVKNHFDRMQYVMKIRLNSIYGACGNEYFRFYDLRNAESVTRSGREILMHQARKIAELIDGEYVYPSESILAGDTDSTFFKTHASNVVEATTIVKKVSEIVNNSFPEFLTNHFLCNENYNKFIKSEFEFIFDRGIFVKKKLYALHLVHNDGKEVDKMKVMGLQLKKTTIPKNVSKVLISFVERLLKGTEWSVLGKEIISYKDELLNSENVLSIGLPKGIKGIEQYTDNYRIDKDIDLPGHIAASIFWNSCLEENKDKENEKISTGMKIKIFYLVKQFGRFKSIAVPADIKSIPSWFSEKYFKLIDREKQINRLIDMPLKNIIGAIGKKMPTKKSLLMDELVEY